MAVCKTIANVRRKVCVGDLDKLIQVQTRSIQPPAGSSVDFFEQFTEYQDFWALIQTVNGLSIFDGSGITQNITHKIYIPYAEGITFENWVQYNGNRYRISRVENLDERNEFFLLYCIFRGSAALAVNEA